MYSKQNYFLKALNAGAALERDWVISCFSVTEYPVFEEVNNDELYNFQLVTSKTKLNTLFCIDKDTDDVIVELEDYVYNEPYLKYLSGIDLNEGDLLNVNRKIRTTYGNCLVNYLLCIYPFGNKIEFITGEIDGDKLVAIIVDKLKATPAEGEPRDPNYFYVDELVKHADAVTYLEVISYTCVPTTSAATMTPNSEVIALRDKLLKQHAHELDNPAVIANIQEQMVKLDKELFKGKRESKFYISGKAYNIVRMKKFGMMGLVGGIGDVKPSLIGTSLSEKWDTNKLPNYIDDIRAGSYARGKSTAVSGYGVKLVYNAFQSVIIAENDCGVTKGLPVKVQNNNYGSLVNRYLLENGKPIFITEEIARSKIGQTIVVRTPMLCKTKPPSFCATCVGKSIAVLPRSVHITASDINSIYMNITMKSMHGKSLSTAKYNFVSDNL